MPTPVLVCGLECWPGSATVFSTSNVGQHWRGAGFTTAQCSGGRTGNGIHCPDVFSSSYAVCNLGTSTRWVGRFYIRFDNLIPGANTQLAGPLAGPGLYYSFSTGDIVAGVTSSTLGSSGFTIVADQWYRIDFDFFINTGGSDTSSVVVTDAAGRSYGSTATATGLSVATEFSLGRMTFTTGEMRFDDIILSNTAADFGAFGPGTVKAYTVTSDGTHNVAGADDFERTLTGTDITNATTTAFQLIDDQPLETTIGDFINCVAPPNNTDYVECVFADSSEKVNPRIVEVILNHHQAGTGSGSSQVRIRESAGGTEDTMLSLNGAGVTTLRYATKCYGTVPGTSNLWTLAALNNLRMRFGYSSDADPDQYLDGIMLEVEYPDPLPGPSQLLVANQSINRSSRW